MTDLLLKRLSPNFIMLDMAYDYDNYSSKENMHGFITNLRDNVNTPRNLYLGEKFCTEFLDGLIDQYGAVSVASGLRYCTRDTPHQWTDYHGVGVDVVFHEQVNNDIQPFQTMWEIDQSGLQFERIIGYAGTEFSCIAWKPDGKYNRGALYDNVRPKCGCDKQKPYYINYGANAQRSARMGKPFTPNPHWRREPGEPVYHTRRTLRPHHIRVGYYFTLLDMCRSFNDFNNYDPHVITDRYYHSTSVTVARMFAAVLDPFVEQHGMVSIVSGRTNYPAPLGNPHGVHEAWNSAIRVGDRIRDIEIAVHHDYPDILEGLEKAEHVQYVEVFDDDQSRYYRIGITDFMPPVWSSAQNTGADGL